MNAIEIENLSKNYYLGEITYKDFYYDFLSLISFTKFSQNKKFIRALNNINLNIPVGKTIGLIGKNGSGKSTLLKLLSRITLPTYGNIRVNGRLTSLLEVGAGFHSDLTCLENIYLNGAINGLTDEQMHKKLEFIINFSELEEFLHTPVKRLSSGNYIKLGFAVAMSVDPDILLVDEILSVSDIFFREKAKKYLENFSQKKNKTTIFVSHNLDFLSEFCHESILINSGKLIDFNKTEIIIQKYKSL